MAGKHVGAWQNTNDPLQGFEWNERTTRAYAEGRYGIAANGHALGTDADRAYKAGAANAGDLDQAFESGGGAGGGPAPSVVTLGLTFAQITSATDVGIRSAGDPIALSGPLASSSLGTPLTLSSGGTFTDFFFAVGASVFVAGDVEIGIYTYDPTGGTGSGGPDVLQGVTTVAVGSGDADTTVSGTGSITVGAGTYIIAFTADGATNCQVKADDGAFFHTNKTNTAPLPATWGASSADVGSAPACWATGTGS